MKTKLPLTADLTGQAALITGASGGFGEHFARVLAQSGATVVLAARRLEALETVAAGIRKEGGSAISVRLDVTSVDSIRSAVAEAVRQVGRIDILINNSGVNVSKAALDLDEPDWSSVIDTNLKGAFLMATEVGRHMRQTADNSGRSGSIINIASVLGLRQAIMLAPYAISKAGLVQLTKVLALELARFRIRVNALAPGYFVTDINRSFFETEAGASLVRRIPQRRLGELDDLTGPLLLLASDASRYMTGSVLSVDGGHLVSTL
jgi:NAD(P)-dependent dehydrogenase (short-subunit alcohol dehydrogenase family)